MQSLIPEIETGKKYLWRRGATEWQCPDCGYVAGSDFNGQQEIVEIIGAGKDFGGAYCSKCEYIELGDFDGWYAAIVDGVLKAVPYTQLEEIKEE